MKKLGIIGGLGPMASAYFYELLIEMTEAKTDQEHMEVLLYSCPGIPDRTAYILGQSRENPVEKMTEVGKALAPQVDVLAIPCITAHYFHRQLEERIGMPILHAVKETAHYLKERNIKKVAVMATDATVLTNLFKQELDRCHITCIYPDTENQKLVMHLIFDDVKAGRAIEGDLYKRVSEHLFEKGAEAILLGCTELSILKKQGLTGAGVLDVTEVLARQCVKSCGKLKEKYEELITR